MILDEALDQILHFALACVAVAFLTLVGNDLNWIGGLIVGLGLGITREVTEHGNPFSRGSLFDLSFWTLGGLIAGLAF